MSEVNRKSLWMLTALLAMVLVLVSGCGTGSNVEESAAQASGGLALPELGTQVGQRIQPFSIRLADGTTVSSASLQDQDRPTFLLYFKHP